MVPKTIESATWLPPNQFQQHTWVRAETSAAQAVSRSASCMRWRRVLTGYGWAATAGDPAGLCREVPPGRSIADGVQHGRPAAAGVPAATRPGMAQIHKRIAYRSRTGSAARYRVTVQRRTVPGVHPRLDRCPGHAAVHPWRRGGIAPPAGSVRSAVRNVLGGGLPAPLRIRGVPADPGRSDAHAVSRRPHQAFLHLPQSRLPAVATGSAQAAGPGVASVRLVLPGEPPRSQGPAGMDSVAPLGTS